MQNVIDQHTWYSNYGTDSDVVLSTRARLARNLSDFPFPEKMKFDDQNRVQTLIFDAFSKFQNSDEFQTLSVSNLEMLGRLVLVERGILTPDMIEKPETAVVIKNEGNISCTINRKDHIHIAAFSSGLEPFLTFDMASTIDKELQKNLQFVGNPDVGYVNSRLRDVGTGLKLSVMLHLPAISYEGLERKLFKSLSENGFDIFACFTTMQDSKTIPIGSFYRIATNSSYPESETDQIANLMAAVKNIIEIERKTRQELWLNKPTFIRDRIYKALAIIRFSRFITFGDGLEFISSLKFGYDLGIIQCNNPAMFFSMLFRVQNSHLAFVAKSGDFSFEKDVTLTEIKTDRLRSLILQEAVSEITLIG